MKKPKIETVEKKAAKKKQVSKPRIEVSKTLPKILTEEELEELEANILVETALNRFRSEMRNLAIQAEDPHNKYLTQETRYDYERLNAVLTEYLDSFVLIGYRPDGEMLSMERARTRRDKEAISKVLQRLVMNKMRNDD